MTLRDLVAGGAVCDPGASSSAPLSRLSSALLDAPLGLDPHTSPQQSAKPDTASTPSALLHAPSLARSMPPTSCPPHLPQQPNSSPSTNALPDFLTGDIINGHQRLPPHRPPSFFLNHGEFTTFLRTSGQPPPPPPLSHDEFSTFLDPSTHPRSSQPPLFAPSQSPPPIPPIPYHLAPLPPPLFQQQRPPIPPNLPEFFPRSLVYAGSPAADRVSASSKNTAASERMREQGLHGGVGLDAKKEMERNVGDAREGRAKDGSKVEGREEDVLKRWVKEIGSVGSLGEDFTSLEDGGNVQEDGTEGLIAAWSAMKLAEKTGEAEEADEKDDSLVWGLADFDWDGEFFGGGPGGIGRTVGRYDLEKRDETILEGYEGMGARELLDEAQRLREEGQVAKGVRVAEEALRREKGDFDLEEKVRGWFVLGMSQAECDEDVKALSAFSECVEACGERTDIKWYKEALLAMAVSYTNELDEVNAERTVWKWLAAYNQNLVSDALPNILPSMATGQDGATASMNQLIKQLEELVAHSEKFTVEPAGVPSTVDLHVALGVLWNVTRDYSKAATALRKAIALRPGDARLWNKLGATLANGFEASEALRAYRKAVDLSPNFVRAWVNVGTAYANTADFPRAARYYLKALSMTDKGGNTEAGVVDVAHVWAYLRTTLIAIEREDLLPLLDRKDPDAFRPHIPF